MLNTFVKSRFLSGKNYLIIIYIFFIAIYSCKKESTERAIDYYDFPDKVLRFPVDTGITDSVLIGFSSTTNNEIKISAYINTYFGTPDSTGYSNKLASANTASGYSLFAEEFRTFCFIPKQINQQITDVNYSCTTMNCYGWSNFGILYMDIGGPDHLFCLNSGNMYMQLRKKLNGKYYAGWMRMLITSDSLVFYDCAFSQEPNTSISAGQQ